MVPSTRSSATETSAAWRRSWSSFPLRSVVVPSMDCLRLCRDRSLQRAPEPQSTTKSLSSPIDDFNPRRELTEAGVHPPASSVSVLKGEGPKIKLIASKESGLVGGSHGHRCCPRRADGRLPAADSGPTYLELRASRCRGPLCGVSSPPALGLGRPRGRVGPLRHRPRLRPASACVRADALDDLRHVRRDDL